MFIPITVTHLELVEWYACVEQMNEKSNESKPHGVLLNVKSQGEGKFHHRVEQSRALGVNSFSPFVALKKKE